MCVFSATLPVRLPASRYRLIYRKNYLTSFFPYACAHLVSAFSSTPLFSIASAHLEPKYPGGRGRGLSIAPAPGGCFRKLLAARRSLLSACSSTIALRNHSILPAS